MSQYQRPSSTDGANSLGYDVESCQAEVKANCLLDEVFREFEQSLEPAYPLSIELLPACLENQASTAQPPDQRAESDLFVPYAPYPGEPFAGESANPAPAAETVTQANHWLQNPAENSDRLFLGLACASILMTAGLWVASKYVFRPPVMPVAIASPALPINPAETQFAQYMQRALDIIGQQQTATVPQPAITSALPPTVEANASAVGATASGVERVYIPVYKPQPAQTVTSTTLSLPPQVAAVAPTAPAAAPVAKPLAPPKAKYTLRGVMEMGDRSVALLDIDGTTQRITVGQPLGATGWELVQVADQKAVVQRQGEVRSITVGQQF
ncbi:MAG: hypothetical protein KME35_11510 [Aphanocapsa sp. GSE-SYN-MK-11-07L]|jgi:hypothetical protein|nr:hypothetical protein [Aphanocapsa sp. GSE-SYN-MK-11-07L]